MEAEDGGTAVIKQVSDAMERHRASQDQADVMWDLFVIKSDDDIEWRQAAATSAALGALLGASANLSGVHNLVRSSTPGGPHDCMFTPVYSVTPRRPKDGLFTPLYSGVRPGGATAGANARSPSQTITFPT